MLSSSVFPSCLFRNNSTSRSHHSGSPPSRYIHGGDDPRCVLDGGGWADSELGNYSGIT